MVCCEVLMEDSSSSRFSTLHQPAGRARVVGPDGARGVAGGRRAARPGARHRAGGRERALGIERGGF